MDTPAISFVHPLVETYCTALAESRAAGLDVVGTVQAFQARFPASGLTWPDIACAFLDPQPATTLDRILGRRERERMDRVAEADARARLAEAKRPIRKAILRESREAIRQAIDLMDAAFASAVADDGHWTGPSWIAYEASMRDLHRRFGICAHGFSSANEGDCCKQEYENRILAGEQDYHLLFSNDGGAYARFAPGDETDDLHVRREHYGAILARDPVLIARSLRYRGGNRPNESKGLSGEEGIRRTLSATITGRRDGIETRSQVKMIQVLVPHILRVMRQRAQRLAKERDIPPSQREDFIRTATSPSLMVMPLGTCGISYRKITEFLNSHASTCDQVAA